MQLVMLGLLKIAGVSTSDELAEVIGAMPFKTSHYITVVSMMCVSHNHIWSPRCWLCPKIGFMMSGFSYPQTVYILYKYQQATVIQAIQKSFSKRYI